MYVYMLYQIHRIMRSKSIMHFHMELSVTGMIVMGDTIFRYHDVRISTKCFQVEQPQPTPHIAKIIDSNYWMIPWHCVFHKKVANNFITNETLNR